MPIKKVFTFSRRTLLKAGAVTLGTMMAPAIVRAQSNPTIRVGFWPVAAALPVFVANQKGFFKEAGLDVQVTKFAGAQQVMEGMLSGRLEGSANGVGSANLAIGEIAQPGMIKIFCTNPSNAKYVLEEIIVPKDSPYKSIADLKGKKVISGPGIQNVTIAKEILAKAGATGAQVTELDIGQHVAALATGQVDAAYTLEPTGTVGRLNGTTRVLEAGVVAHYILGDPLAPWHGGVASLTSEFITKYPEVTKRYIDAYLRGVRFVQQHSDESRQYLAGNTAISGALANEVPLAAYAPYTDLTPQSIAYLQKFYDMFTTKGVFSKRVDATSMIYKA